MFIQPRKRLASILAVLVAILLLSFAVRAVHHIERGNRRIVSGKPVDNDMAAERDGEMSRQEHKRREQIRLSVRQSQRGTISDADLDWLLQMLNTPAPSPDPFAGQLRRTGILSVLKGVGHYTPTQSDKVYSSILTILSNPTAPERGYALAVMRATKDKRAIPVVTSFLSDPDPNIRKIAQWVLSSLSSPDA